MTKPPQARNAIWRALLYVAGVRFNKNYQKCCRHHFGNKCAYCGKKIEEGSRKGHYDHAVAVASSSDTFHLVYACGKCNGDEKRERNWQDFLRGKCKKETLYQRRLKTIEKWLSGESPVHLTEAVKSSLIKAKSEAVDSFTAAVERVRTCAGSA